MPSEIDSPVGRWYNTVAMTVVGRWCEHLIEAGWLLAVVLVAVFLNPFSTRVFEPDRIVLFRSLMLLCLTLAVVHRLERGVSLPRSPAAALAPLRRWRPHPIAAVALLWGLLYLAATVTSIAPRVSWGGGYQRLEGTYTWLAYLVLFFLVLSFLRQPAQLERLVTVLIATTLPVALYGVMQHFRITLLAFSGPGAETIPGRVVSTLGNSIFVAAYLALVIPLTLWRLLGASTAWTETRAPVHGVRAVTYAGIALLQFVCIVFTQSRGPLLGLAVELIVFAFGIALSRGRQRLARFVLGAVVAGMLLGVVLIGPWGPKTWLRNVPVLTRLSGLQNDPTVQGRLLAWQGTLAALQAEPQRLILGYGPETLIRVFSRYMPPRLAALERGATFDRAHNEVLDTLFHTGLIGLAVYLLLYGLLLTYGVRWLKVARTRREVGVLSGLLAGGGLLGALLLRLVHGDWVLVGVGIPTGMVGGLLLYFIGQTMWGKPNVPPEASRETTLLLAALLSAIVGHFVEVQFGIGIVATLSYFWLYAALMVALGTGRLHPLSDAPSVSSPAAGASPPRRAQSDASRRTRRGGKHARRPRRSEPATVHIAMQATGPLIAESLVAALLLGSLAYAFLHGFNVQGARGPALVLIVATWLGAGVLILVERARTTGLASAFVIDAPLYAVASLAWALPFVLYHRANAQTLERLQASYLAFVVWLLLTLIAIAVALGIGEPSPRRVVQQDQAVLYPALLILALALIWTTNLRAVRADIYHKIGVTTMEAGLWDQAIPSFRHAIALAPNEDSYYLYLGSAYVEQAQVAPDAQTKETWMEQARQTFERGWALNPTNSDHPRHLGRMYRVWAGFAAAPQLREERLRKAWQAYQAAVRLSPQSAELRVEFGRVLLALGRADEAERQFRKAVELNVGGQMAQAYAGLGDVALLRGDAEGALKAYQKAVRYNGQSVLQEKLRAVSEHSKDVKLRESLALVYAALGRTNDALKALQAAADIAPDAEQAEVQALMKRLQH